MFLLSGNSFENDSEFIGEAGGAADNPDFFAYID